MSTVKVPGLGEVKKSTAVLVTAVAAIVAVIWWRNRQAAASPAPAGPAGTSTADTSTIDPATGFVSGSPEDEQALADQSAAFDSTGLGFGALGTGGAFFGGGGSVQTGPAGPGGFADNAQWSQYAEQYLTQNGANAETVGNALGKYITGQPLTASQSQVIDQAIAFAGYPPVEGPGGNPPGIRTAASPHPQPKPSPQSKVKVPAVAGKQYGEAVKILAAAHLRAKLGTPHAGIVAYTRPAAGTEVPRNSAVTLYFAASG